MNRDRRIRPVLTTGGAGFIGSHRSRRFLDEGSPRVSVGDGLERARGYVIEVLAAPIPHPES